MKLRTASIKNFRKITDLSIEFSRSIAVIVGPNAVGKTTIFEAIRLAKALLAPRGHDEAAQVLMNLGASTPNILFGPFHYDFTALAGDPSKPVDIRLGFQLGPSDIAQLKPRLGDVAQQLAAAKIGRNFDQGRMELIQYFSSEEGQINLRSSLGNL